MIKDSKEHLISAVGGLQALLHALCPGILCTSASDKIKDLHSKVSDRS